MSDWLNEIKIEDLPEQYQEMACIVGIESTLKLAEHYNKQGFYFSGIDEIIRRKKEEFIRKNFDGRNHKELARATGYSVVWVYEILKKSRDEKQNVLFE